MAWKTKASRRAKGQGVLAYVYGVQETAPCVVQTALDAGGERGRGPAGVRLKEATIRDGSALWSESEHVFAAI